MNPAAAAAVDAPSPPHRARADWQRLLPDVRPHTSSLAVLLSLSALNVALSLLVPWPLKLIVDHALPGRPLPPAVDGLTAWPGAGTAVGLLTWLAAGVLVLFLLQRLLRAVQGYLEYDVGERLKMDLAARVFAHLQRQSLRFHHNRPAGDLVQRVAADSACVRELLFGVALPGITSTVTLLAMAVILWRLEPLLTIVALAVAVPLPLMMRWLTARIIARSTEEYEATGRQMAVAEQGLAALPAIRAFGREDATAATFDSHGREALRTYLRALTAQTQFRWGVDLTTALGTGLVLGLGGHLALQGTLTVGQLLVFMAYLVGLQGPVNALTQLSTVYGAAQGRLRRLVEVLEAGAEVPQRGDATPLPGRASGALRFEQVDFAYEAGAPVLQGIDLEVRAGETLALIGASGAGKSTLVSLVARLQDPVAGTVRLDGTDLRTLRLDDVRRQVAWVLQEPLLLPVSVADNIAYARPGAPREAIEAAACAAQADGFIRALPLGYETVLGERGATLSGGQRQRLAIARALLRDAPIVILDEPTAALDLKTESELLEALRVLLKDRTALLIAHRPSTIRHAQRIAVLDGGRLVEVGTHDQLLARGGAYASWLRVAGQGKD